MTEDVKLIGAPEKLIEKVYTAYRNCYSPKSAGEIWEELHKYDKPFMAARTSEEQSEIMDLDREYQKELKIKMLDLILNKVPISHSSPLEHAHFVFTIDEISRAATDQLDRHRHMSFSQKSFRYVEIKEDLNEVNMLVKGYDYEINKERIKELSEKYFVNPYNENNKSFEVRNISNLNSLKHYLYEVQVLKVKPEDARGILPIGVKTSMVASLNLRELIHVANLRLCTTAQTEIRDTVKKMCELVIEKEPWLTAFLQPKCYKNGYCDEKNGCGIFPQKVEHGRNYWEGFYSSEVTDSKMISINAESR